VWALIGCSELIPPTSFLALSSRLSSSPTSPNVPPSHSALSASCAPSCAIVWLLLLLPLREAAVWWPLLLSLTLMLPCYRVTVPPCHRATVPPRKVTGKSVLGLQPCSCLSFLLSCHVASSSRLNDLQRPLSCRIQEADRPPSGLVRASSSTLRLPWSSRPLEIWQDGVASTVCRCKYTGWPPALLPSCPPALLPWARQGKAR
jgi:hypothetical protein